MRETSKSDTATSVLNTAILDRLRDLDENGDKALLKSLLKMYAERSPTAIEEMRQALRRGDCESLRQQAHALRSSHSNVGATNVVSLLYKIEHDASTFTKSPAEEQDQTLEKLRLEIGLAQQALAQYIDQDFI